MPENKLNPLALALGATALGGALAASPALAAEDPFRITELSRGYMVAGGHGGGAEGAEEKKDPCPHSRKDKDAEGKCGEGKCGEGKCGEGKCGEGKCGEAGDAPAEGRCGEGKCGGN